MNDNQCITNRLTDQVKHSVDAHLIVERNSSQKNSNVSNGNRKWSCYRETGGNFEICYQNFANQIILYLNNIINSFVVTPNDINLFVLSIMFVWMFANYFIGIQNYCIANCLHRPRQGEIEKSKCTPNMLCKRRLYIYYVCLFVCSLG